MMLEINIDMVCLIHICFKNSYCCYFLYFIASQLVELIP